MQIEITEQTPTTRIIDIETPQFHCVSNCLYYAITEESVITVSVNHIAITSALTDPTAFKKRVTDLLVQEKSTREQFEEMYHKAMINIKEQASKIGIQELEGLGALAE